MAESMREIRRRIRSVEATEHITNAMRLVSAAKFRRSKGRYDQILQQLDHVTEIMEQMMETAGEQIAIPGAEPAQESGGGTIAVVITSNRGLCGGYNTGVVRLLEKLGDHLKVFAIGSRGLDYCVRQDIPVLGSYLGAPEQMTAAHVAAMTAEILREYDQSRGGQILLVSAEYINTLHQEPSVRKILPWGNPENEKTADSRNAAADNTEREYIPSYQAVQQYILPKYLELTLYKAVCEAAVCEHAARRTAMENASENGKEMLAHLSLTYNRARQQAITDELIEIVSGSEALKQGV